MKKITNIMMAVLLSTATITACGLQTNYEHKGQAKEQGLRLEGTTYNTLKISPQIYFRPYNGWQFYINADVPVWHKTVGLQMVNSWALQTGIQYYL